MTGTENGEALKAMAPVMKKILGALITIVMLAVFAWGTWLTSNALASGQDRATDETAKAAHAAQIKQLKEAHTTQVREMNEHLREFNRRLRNIEQALAVHDIQDRRPHRTH